MTAEVIPEPRELRPGSTLEFVTRYVLEECDFLYNPDLTGGSFELPGIYQRRVAESVVQNLRSHPQLQRRGDIVLAIVGIEISDELNMYRVQITSLNINKHTEELFRAQQPLQDVPEEDRVTYRRWLEI
ncbi:TPA: hypothetical protein DIV49_00235 [Candidatus Saccharibacteria bacterium]|nr:hypothetical protein [Candidatus Saccharibacteria bacterium]HRJ90808.1 hypothetical protein [Candidatus Saccharibacteria bacterium]